MYDTVIIITNECNRKKIQTFKQAYLKTDLFD